MRNIYIKYYFWIILIFIVLLCTSIPYFFPSFSLKKLLFSATFWTAIGSVATIFSVISAADSIRKSTLREKKQATLDAFDRLKKDEADVEKKIHKYSEDDIKKIMNNHDLPDVIDSE